MSTKLKKNLLDDVLHIAKGIEPISFYDVDPNLKDSIQNATKNLYSIIKRTLPDDSGPLSELITQDLTSEQIWEEINLANNPMIKLLNKNIRSNLNSIEEIDFPTVLSKEEEERMLEEEEDDEEEDIEGALLNEEDFDEDGEMDKFNDDDNDEEDGDNFDHLRRRKYREDESDFFNVEKMEEFVQQAENQNNDDQELQEMLYGKSVGEDGQNEFATYKYDDFFGDNREREEDDEFHGMKERLAGFNGKMPYHLLSKDDKDFEGEQFDDLDDDEEEEEEQKKDKKKAAEDVDKKKKKGDDKEESDELEKLDPNYSKQKALKQQIKLLEEENLSKKEWALLGEVSSKARPLDSLIEKNVEFDVATRPVPIITEDFTDRLEKMIKKRILQEAWDDVVRKEVVNIPYKPQIELNKEKSEKGLSEIYEQQYKDKMQEAAGKPNSIIEEIESSGNEKLDNFKVQIHNDWEKLQYKLDIMSNMSFAPKPPTLNVIKKQKNTKSVTVLDEATPQTINASELIAPQEVLSVENKPLKGESELTKEERKRKRKLNKEKYKERLEENIKKYGKSKKQVEKEVLAQRNVTKASREDNTQYTKSSQFFQKLQQDSQKPKKKKKKNDKKGSASKYLF